MSFVYQSRCKSGFQTGSGCHVPHASRIAGGLKAGKAIFVQGVVPSGSDSFVVNLKCGESEGDDIAFQFKPRFSSNCMTLNSRQRGSWGKEEKLDLALKQGSSFDLNIVAHSEHYQVFLGGREVGRFQHRLPLGNVNALSVEGPVSITNVAFTENLPYEGPISGGLREGMALYLQGVIATDAEYFVINFKTGQSSNDDIAFHFNPQMGKMVVMNSFRNGKWETQESVSETPFKRGQAFEMFTVFRSEGYQVYVNGKELYTFKYRIPLEKVSALNIAGGVAVNLFGFIQNWSTSSFVTEAKSTITNLGSAGGKLEILHPVQNPNLPYEGPISGGLREGMALYLQGVIATDAEYFVINFKTGQSSNDDIAFHFNPQMGKIVVMNSFRNGKWETQESVSENPFKRGQAFEMFTVFRSEGYQVYVNGKELYTFKYRIPLEKVSALNIAGGVAVNLFGFIQNWSTSSFVTEAKSTITNLGSAGGKFEILHPVQNPNLPYVGPISGGLREGMALYLQGVIATDAEYFVINFKTGQSSNDDIAFHFNPRMDKMVVMNSFRNGKWETQESVSETPFKRGQAFEMFTVFRSEGYQVYVNGKGLYTFKYRIPLEKVSALNIAGGVAVNLFGFIQNWSTSSFVTEAKSTITNLGSAGGKLEILHPVQNPNLPYEGPISGGLREGMALYLQGVIATDAEYFVINFKTGQSSNDDIAFHFNPRMDKIVVMNSFRNEKWETQESISETPFKRGQAFEMFTVFISEGYQVYVNGKGLYTFKYRIPLEKVSALNIAGGVAVNLFGFIQNWSTSSFVTEAKSTITNLGSAGGKFEILHPVQNPNLPYEGPISGGLREGMALYLQGVIATDAEYFVINFKTGQSSNDDIAFHFNPRMDKMVVMNSFRNEKWETQESISENPFKRGQAFEMFTVFTSECYQVYVNGKGLYTFKYRIPLEKVSALNIAGGVAVNLFGFIQNWSTSSFVTEAKSPITNLGSTGAKLEILQPVQNPNLPYVGPISGGLREGMALYLQGVIPTDGDKFEINLKTGQSGNDDIAFQFKPQMGQKVTMNSFRNGKWEKEESISDNPFKTGQAFQMFTVVRPEGYQVYVNGEKQYTFNHRIPLEKVSALNIVGGVTVNMFGFIQNWTTSFFLEETRTITNVSCSHTEPSTKTSEILQPVQNPNLPYVGPISGGLREGMALYLQGVVPTTADQFEINFKTGQSGNDDIAFHLNPRIDHEVTMNSFRNGKWEKEESVSENPFKKGKTFEMFTAFKPEGYQVYVNGKELYTFRNRIPLEKVSAVNIAGGVAVKLFGFIQNWSSSSFVTKVKSTMINLGSSGGELEILQPVQNPNLPYEGPISGGLRESTALYLQGVVPTDADHFEINFKTGQSSNDDIAFHFNPQMGKMVVMNSFRNGKWETQESVSENPFKKGQAFEMFTVFRSEGYQVYVNGKELYTFKNRIPLEKVSALNIAGGVAVNLFGYITKRSSSSFVTEVKSTTTRLSSSGGEFEILQPVQNPNLPYVGPISGGLREGMALYLQGVVPTTADQFEINFKTGQSGNDDIAFHLNPRIDHEVTMNSFRNGKWEKEESVSENPFKRGETFEMFTAFKPEGYQVYVNGKELYTFKNRIPLEKVSAVNIAGGVAVNLFGFIQNWSSSSFVTKVKSTMINLGSSGGELEILQPVQNPNLPYEGPISGGLRESTALYLQGVVPTDADQFEINFKTGQSSNDDIAFHFNPQMGKMVVMNSFRNGKWETQESVSENPFKRGQAFEMFTVFRSEGYQVYVNGKELYTFKYRIPLEKVSALNIAGGVAVNLFGFVTKRSSSSFVTEVKSTTTRLSSSGGEWATVHSEILQPVQNPNLPYIGKISGGLREGLTLFIQGVVPTNADRFSINFKCMSADKQDNAFHFNPRLGSSVVMNSLVNGKWGAEERVSDNPFKHGEEFEMFILITREGYQVHVKGKENFMFKHRIPLENVNTIHIYGDVSISFLGFVQGE